MDPDGGSIVTYAWNWGDGTPVQAGAVSRPDHVYAADGTYTVTLTATDNEGDSSTFALPVTVPNTAPVAVGSIVVDGMTVKVDSSGSSDPDGTVASHSWSFGPGLPFIAGPTGEYTYATPGTYRIRLTVTDDDGASTRLDQQVTVPGATTPPPPPPPTTTPGTPTTPGTGTGTTPPPAQTSKAAATLRAAKVVKKRVRGKVAVRVLWKVVRAGGGTATGTVKVKVGKKTYTGKLKAGRVMIKLGKYAPRGKLKMKARYGGDARTLRAATALKVRLR
jgi:PKD repeat protein